MQRQRRLRKKSEFLQVQRRGRWWANDLLVLRVLPNRSDTSRFGFLVSGRVGNAVVRNRVKRRLKEITRREPVRNGWDVVLIARAGSAKASFGALQSAVRDLHRRGRLLSAGGNEGTGPEVRN